MNQINKGQHKLVSSYDLDNSVWLNLAYGIDELEYSSANLSYI